MDNRLGSPQIEDSAMHSSSGMSIYELASRLFPICRSLTGDGVRETLAIVGEHLPLKIHRIQTGTQLFDWQAPQEWLIRGAYIMDSAGRRVVDFAEHNLHVVNFSTPVRKKLTLNELKEHIHTLPDQPDLIPYRTCYHTEAWGFCMTHNALMQMKELTYEVVIDAERRDGSLNFGEFIHQGETEETFLLSTHLCHPSLANDNCSGIALLTRLGEALKSRKTRFTYRLLFGPATFGALAWLKQNEENLGLVKHGIVLSCVGDGGGPNYKRSRRGNSEIDRIMTQVLEGSGLPEAKLHDFGPTDMTSVSFVLRASICRLVCFSAVFMGSFLNIILLLTILISSNPNIWSSLIILSFKRLRLQSVTGRRLICRQRGEPQLGRRGLYGNTGGGSKCG